MECLYRKESILGLNMTSVLRIRAVNTFFVEYFSNVETDAVV